MRAGGFAEDVVRMFVDARLTPLIALVSVALGVGAVIVTPREEEPQISVPMMDVVAELPGASAREVEERLAIPLEKRIAELANVEYVYSTSMPSRAMIVVRFLVGEDPDRAYLQLDAKLRAFADRLPPGAGAPIVKPRSIDDVPVLALTFWSATLDHGALRRLAAQLDDAVRAVPDVAQTTLIGGRRMQLRVRLDPARLAGAHLDAAAVESAIARANLEAAAGALTRADGDVLVRAGPFIRSADEVARLVLSTAGGRLVRVQDVASVAEEPEEPREHTLYLPRGAVEGPGPFPAVTLAVAKRPGTNAVTVARDVQARVRALAPRMLPASVHVEVTRDHGRTAQDKSDELLEHLWLAVVSVSVIIALFLGPRPALVVLVAVPVTLALTLVAYALLGYTLNRVTLFALIFSIGILVDDPIVDVENIVRHFGMKENRSASRVEVTVRAVNEVRSPLILATIAVIVAILPMAFVHGLMGPYMRPIPVGSSLAMLLSMLVAFAITPWAAQHVLAAGETHEEKDESRATRLYRSVMGVLVTRRGPRAAFLAGVSVLLVLALALVPARAVRVKMLPFDNKSELEVVLDMPEGTTLERTTAVALRAGRLVADLPEITGVVLHAGSAGPATFNGLVRHYDLRAGPAVASLSVALTPRDHRAAQSHEIAMRVRAALAPLQGDHGARIKTVEIPPGPPVLQTLVAEVYGPDDEARHELSRELLALFDRTPGVVDADWYVEAPAASATLDVDREKAAWAGVTPDQVVRLIETAISGRAVGLAHREREKEDVPIVLELPRLARASLESVMDLRIRSAAGALVPLTELVRVRHGVEPPHRYRKNLLPVVYVTGDVGGAEESPVYAILALDRAIAGRAAVHHAAPPRSTESPAVKWDGEWHITYEVFRDLGLAFAVALLLIYALVVGWFESFVTPLVIMTPIPLSLIGILPAHWASGGFFTATSMIGFIAGAGIVVRNSIILVDFIELRRRQGMALEDAVVDAGAVRFRPMLLTASAVVAGAAVILFDPIFQGLALSLMAGEVAATLLSRMVVPVLYMMAAPRGH